MSGENPIPGWVRLEKVQRADPEDLSALNVRTPNGALLPLAAVAAPEVIHAPTAETHQALEATVDVIGYRRNIAVTHLHDNVRAALADLVLQHDYRIHYEGEIKQMNESFSRLGQYLVLGLVTVYLMLAITFRSFLDPIAIMASLPLAVGGAAWGMMLADKHGCLPSFMGFILLMGIVVNNGILLVDFTTTAQSLAGARLCSRQAQVAGPQPGHRAGGGDPGGHPGLETRGPVRGRGARGGLCGGGMVMGRFRPERWVKDYVWKIHMGETRMPEPERGLVGRHRYAWGEVREIVGRMWRWVPAGSALGALFHGYVPQDWVVANLGGRDNWLAVWPARWCWACRCTPTPPV